MFKQHFHDTADRGGERTIVLHQIVDDRLRRDHLAQDTGAPTLRISCQTLRTQAQRFLNGFSGETSYAVKANDHPGIVKLLGESGVNTFDVASLEEMSMVKSVLPSAVLHYHNPVRSHAETMIAMEQFGCKRFAVDHMDELRRIIAMARQNADIEVAIRFRDDQPTGAVQDFQSKFGVDKHEAAGLVKSAAEAGLRVGLTFHPGSQTLEPAPYEHHIATAAQIAHLGGVELDFLNVGGGFPAEYQALEASPLEAFFERIAATRDQCFDGPGPALECEPGRALVAKSGTLRVTIKAVRKDRRELFLNDGIYGGLMEAYQFNELRPAYRHHPKQDAEPMTGEWKAYGPTCDPADVLPFTLRLDNLPCEGDQIDFLGMGAYSTATSTRFNGFGALETVFV